MQNRTTDIPRRQCRHCGTPFQPRHADEHFCCAGCHAVHAMIRESGLDHFYALRQGMAVPSRPLEPRDFGWLQALATQAEATAQTNATTQAESTTPPQTHHHADAGKPHTDQPTATLSLPLNGIHCAGCRWLISELFTRQPQHGTCQIDPEGHLIHFSWHVPQAGKDGSHFDAAAFATTLLHFGYALENPAQPRNTSQTNSADSTNHNSGHNNSRAGRNGSNGDTTPSDKAAARKRLAQRVLLCGVLALNAIILSLPGRFGTEQESFPLLRVFSLLVLLCATLATGLCVGYFWQRPTPAKGVRWPRVLAGALVALLLAPLVTSAPTPFTPEAAATVSFITLLAALLASVLQRRR